MARKSPIEWVRDRVDDWLNDDINERKVRVMEALAEGKKREAEDLRRAAQARADGEARELEELAQRREREHREFMRRMEAITAGHRRRRSASDS